jgi:L-ascorbate oxidase
LTGKFAYEFTLSQTGTYWYHAHTAAQYGDGLLGPVIIDYPDIKQDPVYMDFKYSRDYPMLFQDWYHELGGELALHYRGPFKSYPSYIPQFPWPHVSLLINGRGQYDCKFTDCSDVKGQCIPIREPLLGQCDRCYYQPDEYLCSKGNYTRLRLINGANSLALRFWIEYHQIYIVAKDGIEIKPKLVKYVSIPVGQRLDVLVNCSQDVGKKYKMFVSINPRFIPTYNGQNYPNITSYSYLKYEEGDGNPLEPIEPEIPCDLPLDSHIFGDNITEEYGYEPLVPRMAPIAQERLILKYEVRYDASGSLGSPLEYWVVNNVSFVHPSEPLLQSRWFNVSPSNNNIDGDYGTNIIKLEHGKVCIVYYCKFSHRLLLLLFYIVYQYL